MESILLEQLKFITNIKTIFCNKNFFPDELTLQRLYATFAISNNLDAVLAFGIYKKLFELNINDNYDLLTMKRDTNNNYFTCIAWYLLFAKEYNKWCDNYDMMPNLFIKQVADSNLSFLMKKFDYKNELFVLLIMHEYGKETNNPDIIEFVGDQINNLAPYTNIINEQNINFFGNNNKNSCNYNFCGKFICNPSVQWLLLISKYTQKSYFLDLIKNINANEIINNNIELENVWIKIWCLKYLKKIHPMFNDIYKMCFMAAYASHLKNKNNIEYQKTIPQLIVFGLLN